jgi:ribosome-associated toxin RatA of RatAB toxin-antitoxin module
MIAFHISKEIHASLDVVWNLVSDIDREPEFWHGTKSVKNIRKEGNIVERETVIAFRNAVCKEIVTLDPKNSVKKKIIDGPITGTKDIKVTPLAANKTLVDVQWDIIVRGFFGLFRGRIKKHISQGTRDALDRISTTVT